MIQAHKGLWTTRRQKELKSGVKNSELYILAKLILHIHIICYTYTRQNTVCIFHATHIIWLIICYVIFQNKGVQGAREPMTGNLDLHEPCLLFAVEVRGKRLSSSKACGQQT